MKKKGIHSDIYLFNTDDGKTITVSSKEAHDYILHLRNKCSDLEEKNLHLTLELSAIKPVIDTKELQPALSRYCSDCKYCVKSRYDRSILGCCKDNVCSRYRPEDD